MGRAPCCEKVGLKRGKWTAEEDGKLIKYIASNGVASWRSLPKMAGLLRCGKSCRLRWMNYLRPDLKRGNITKEEDEVILKLHETLGNRWSVIAGHLSGRTDNEIKNHWNTHLKKKLQGLRKTNDGDKEAGTMPNKPLGDDARPGAKKRPNNASGTRVKNGKGGGDGPPAPTTQGELNEGAAPEPHQPSEEGLEHPSHVSSITGDEEAPPLNVRRGTTADESQPSPSLSCPTAFKSGDTIMPWASIDGPDQAVLQQEALIGLSHELLSPMSLAGDGVAGGASCLSGEGEGGTFVLNESGLVGQQEWAMGGHGEETWLWDLEEIEDKLWGEEGEMWSWIGGQ